MLDGAQMAFTAILLSCFTGLAIMLLLVLRGNATLKKQVQVLAQQVADLARQSRHPSPTSSTIAPAQLQSMQAAPSALAPKSTGLDELIDSFNGAKPDQTLDIRLPELTGAEKKLPAPGLPELHFTADSVPGKKNAGKKNTPPPLHLDMGKP